MRSRPDVLVLGAGGVLGEAWLSGVLAGLEDAARIELNRCDYLLGTSAGAIVAARLAAGLPLDRPARCDLTSEPHADRDPDASPGAGGPLAWTARAAEQVASLALELGTPAVPLAIELATPTAALTRAAVLRTAPRPRESLGDLRRRLDETGVRFDGRLRVAAVARRSGRRFVFGQPGAPAATVAQAVEASCAVPWLFAPVRIGDVEYVDGGIWSPTNLDAAPVARGSLVLCLSPTAGRGGTSPLARGLRGASRAATEVEATALRARGAEVTVVAPDARCVAAIGGDLMDRGRRSAVLAAAYRQGRALGAAGPASPRLGRVGAGLRALHGSPARARAAALERLVRAR
jgi:NTE family protein